MSTISSYPHGFANGMSVREVPIDVRLNSIGNVFWVDSVNGSNGNKGNYTLPFATIAYAVSRCTANQGDIIYVAASHTETIVAAGTLTINKAGVTIVCMGEGSTKSTITFTTATTASVIISAANVTLVNARFLTGIDNLSSPITITGADCKLINCEWYDAAAKSAVNCVVATNAAARMMIDGWKYNASTTGTQKVTNIKFADNASVVLKNIDIVGDFSTAPINITAAATNLRLSSIYLNNTNATPKPGIDLHANTTGFANDIDIRIASGSSYVSSVAKVNWSRTSNGYYADGNYGSQIGSAPV
jgi:hypothetical protein